MKVLVINTSSSTGGAAISAVKIHNAIRDMGIESYFIAGRGESSISDKIKVVSNSFVFKLVNVFVYRLLGIQSILFKSKWNDLLENLDKYDIVHLHNVHGYYLPRKILKQLLSKPCVWTIHDYWLVTGGLGFLKSPYEKINIFERIFFLSNLRYPAEWLNRSCFRRKSNLNLLKKYNPSLVVVSNDMKNRICSMGLDSENVSVIPHGIFNDKILNKTDINTNRLLQIDNKHIFVYISAQVLNPIKGFEVLLEAAKKLPINKYKIYVIGEYSANHITKIMKLNLPFIFLGKLRQSELKKHLSACDTYVSTSYDETFGLTVVEAMSCGAQVLCSDLSVFHEVTDNNAIFFEPGNFQQLADSMFAIIQSPISLEKRSELSLLTKRRFEEKVMGQKYLNLYKTALKKNKL